MVEPLDLIGRSQTEPNIALRDLSSKLAQILEQNRGRRDVADIQGATARDVAAFGRNFPGASAFMGAGPELAQIRASEDLARNAPAALAAAKLGAFPEILPDATVGQVVSPGTKALGGIPLATQAAQRTGLDAAKQQFKTGTKRKSKEIYSLDSKGNKVIIPPVVGVEDVEKTEERTDTRTTKGGGRRFDRLGRPITAPTPSAAADTGIDVFTATPTELAAQGLVRAKLRYDTKGYKKGDTVVYRQLGDQMGPVVAHRKGKI